jgi:hypothetical protein
MQFVLRDGEVADSLVHRLLPMSKEFQDDAQDFFIILPGTFNWDVIPDFVIGRPGYDNWLVDYAFHNSIDLVDVTRTVHAIHQSGVDGNKAGHTVRACCSALFSSVVILSVTCAATP